MGGSGSSAVSRSSSRSDMSVFMPVIGTRLMNGQESENTSKIRSHFTPRAHIIKTAFTGVWSTVLPESYHPESRTGQVTVAGPDGNFAYIGCGISERGTYLNDFWVLDLTSLSWSQLELTGDRISPRTGARGIYIQDNIVLFGGYDGANYLNDVYVIDLTEKTISQMETGGQQPTPRSMSVIGQNGVNLFIWGGFDGGTPSELYVLNLETAEWTCYPQEVAGRASPAFTQKGSKIYAFGSSKVGGINVINTETRVVEWKQTTGSEPIPTISDASMEVVDEFLLLFGGRSQSQWSLVYALDISRGWWFIVHVLPDNVSVSEVDGHITELGLFTLPRTDGMGLMYCPARRSLFGFLGAPFEERPRLSILSMEEALSVIHLRDDMLRSLHLCIPK